MVHPFHIFPKIRWRSKKGEYLGRTIESTILTGTEEPSRKENRSSSGDQREATTTGGIKDKTVESAILARTQGSSENSSSHRKGAKQIEIDGQGISSVSFLVDGTHVVSSSMDGTVRRWQVEDGEEVGKPMHAGSSIFSVAVSQDGKWIVGGTDNGLVTVWNAESYSKVIEWQAHTEHRVYAVDVSPDGTRIATGADDQTACVWSLPTGERLLDPFKHDQWVVAVKFSPNGRLIATATWRHDVRVYDSQNGRLLVEFPVKVDSALNQSLAWASDSKQLFALSRDGNVRCLDVSTGKVLWKWAIHSSKDTKCIALAGNGTFIAVSAASSISFWDTATREQIGSVIEHTRDIWSMAISTNYDLVISGDKTFTLSGLYDILPSRYFHHVCVSA